MIDVNQALAQPMAETFQAGGLAPTIPAAHDLAWNALDSVLGGDPIGPWKLKAIEMTYTANPEAPGVQFVAEFLRDPAEDGEAA